MHASLPSPGEAPLPAVLPLDELTPLELIDRLAEQQNHRLTGLTSQRHAIGRAMESVATRYCQGGRLLMAADPASVPDLQLLAQRWTEIFGIASDRLAVIDGEQPPPLMTVNDIVVGLFPTAVELHVSQLWATARQIRAITIGLGCDPDHEPVEPIDHLVIIPGSDDLVKEARPALDRLTLITVLDWIWTGAMIQAGIVYEHTVIDFTTTTPDQNSRARQVVMDLLRFEENQAQEILDRCQGEIKTALAVHHLQISPDQARERLQAARGQLRRVLNGVVRGDSLAGRVPYPDLVLGIDGGGTNTIAILARGDAILGRGLAGPSNIQSVGVTRALAELDRAVDRAFQTAGISRGPVGAACLGLAGVDRDEGLPIISTWAKQIGLTERVSIANDATLLLAAGTPEGWGLAVIAGTGSIAFVKKSTGEVGRCGGWGYTLGDEGSAYQIALAALRYVCRAYDRSRPNTILVDLFLKRMNLKEPPDLIPAVYRGPWDRAAIAGLAPLVLDAVELDDPVAIRIVRHEAEDLALTAATAIRNDSLPESNIPIALAGGVFLGSATYRQFFLDALVKQGIQPGLVHLVADPAMGAVVLARQVITQPGA